MKSIIDLNRVFNCLEFIKANPTARYPIGWIDGVKDEARELGLLPPLATKQPLANCRPGIDRQITYGGDMPDVF